MNHEGPFESPLEAALHSMAPIAVYLMATRIVNLSA